MYIKKVANFIKSAGLIRNAKSDSQEDTYSCDYINNNVGIVESGSNENGSYIKYEDGTLVNYKKVSVDLAVNRAWGGLYISENIDLGNYAMEFFDDSFSVNVFYTSGLYSAFCMCSDYFTKSSIGKVQLIRGTSSDRTAGIINIQAIGKWK